MKKDRNGKEEYKPANKVAGYKKPIEYLDGKAKRRIRRKSK